MRSVECIISRLLMERLVSRWWMDVKELADQSLRLSSTEGEIRSGHFCCPSDPKYLVWSELSEDDQKHIRHVFTQDVKGGTQLEVFSVASNGLYLYSLYISYIYK